MNTQNMHDSIQETATIIKVTNEIIIETMIDKATFCLEIIEEKMK